MTHKNFFANFAFSAVNNLNKQKGRGMPRPL